MYVLSSSLPWRLLASSAASAVFLGAALLHPVWRDSVDETPAIVAQTLALALFCCSFALTIGGLWSIGLTRGRSLLPLIPQALAIACVFVPSVAREIDLAEFDRMWGWRTEVVARVQSGELRPQSSYVEVVALPGEFPRSVSDAGGQRAVQVVQRETGFDVVFLPPKGIRARATGYVYRSDDTWPETPSDVLPQYRHSEKIAPHWYRLVS